MIKKIILAFIILINFASFAYGQNDQIINARNTNIQITAPNSPSGTVPWITLANQTYVLAPINPDFGFCVSVVNNNTTSAHSFSVTAFQTGDSNAIDYSHNTGRYATLAIVGTPSPVAANSTSTFYLRSNGAAKVAFVFSGATTQAGSPDTVDVYAVQTTAAGCGTVNPSTGQAYTLSTPNAGTSSAPPIMAVSDGLSQAFDVQPGTITNPVIGQVIIHVNANSGTRSLYFDKLLLSCSAACSINFVTTTSVGTTCTTFVPANQKQSSGTTSTGTANNGCATPPTIGSTVLGGFPLAAGIPAIIDLRGFISSLSTNTGVELVMAAGLTGTVNASLFWYEK